MAHDNAPPDDFPPPYTDEELEQYAQHFDESDYEPDAYPPEFDDGSPPPDSPRTSGRVTRGGGSSSITADIEMTLRTVLAAQQGHAFPDLATMVNEIAADRKVLDALDEHRQAVWVDVIEILGDIATNAQGGSVDLCYVPTASLYSPAVQAELTVIGGLASSGTPPTEHPSVTWFGLREKVQRHIAARTTRNYLSTLEGHQGLEVTLDAFAKLEPPTTRRAATRERSTLTVRQLVQAKRAAEASSRKVRLSSGYRTLDYAFTGAGEAMGFITPGEGSVIAGPTGTGKSSFTYCFVPSLTQDLINWGLPFAKVIFAHTEEESIDKIRAMQMDEGQRHHHLADNLVVQNVGTSRRLLAMTIYDLVAEAHVRSLETGLPITDFLPYALILDYIQSLSEQGESEVVATSTTAEFLLRGVQAWNADEMAKFGGISYREYTGSPWPDGMEHHRVAGIYMAQLVKQDDKSLLYRPGQRDCQLADFVLEDTNNPPVWRDPGGGGWAWEVREGDLRLFKQNAIRGSGVILQNATSILILHRSRAYNNPAIETEDGSKHLEDTRSRLLLDKTRTGSSLKCVPMSFDLDHDAFRANYIDELAERALAQGRFQCHETWQRRGDPILPIRPSTSPFAGVSY